MEEEEEVWTCCLGGLVADMTRREPAAVVAAVVVVVVPMGRKDLCYVRGLGEGEGRKVTVGTPHLGGTAKTRPAYNTLLLLLLLIVLLQGCL